MSRLIGWLARLTSDDHLATLKLTGDQQLRCFMIEKVPTFFEVNMQVKELRDLVPSLADQRRERQLELGRTYVIPPEFGRSEGGVCLIRDANGNANDRPRKRPRGLLVPGARY